jgi:hypothetical protein
VKLQGALGRLPVVQSPGDTLINVWQLPRTWETLAEDRTRLINRLKGLSATQDVQVPIDKEFLDHLQAARVCDGTPVPAGARHAPTVAHNSSIVRRRAVRSKAFSLANHSSIGLKSGLYGGK